MASLFSKVKKYLENNSKTWDDEKDNIKLQNDGSGSYIHTWNVSGLAEPNDTALNSVASDADADEALFKVLKKRKKEYLDFGTQLDKLYHDINDGKLDKNGSWYKHIKAVKDANAKE